MRFTRKYRTYMQSDQWRAKRQQHLKRAPRCFCCGTSIYLQVHHLTYDRLGQEAPDDLQTLCVACHKRVHQLVKQFSYRTKEASYIAAADYLRSHYYVVKVNPEDKRRKQRPLKPMSKRSTVHMMWYFLKFLYRQMSD